MKLKLGIAALIITPLLIASLVALGAARGKAEAAQSTASGGGGKAVVAKIGDKAITLEELDKKALQQNFKAFTELYEARRSALDDLIADILLERQAKAQGITKDELVKQEITEKVKTVTDEDVKTWYDENQGRVRGRTLEEVAPQVKNFLQQMRGAERHDMYINSLKQGAAVKIMLEPPRQQVKVASDDPSKGPASAPVQIVEFSDFQ